jgi:two-component system, chemotaxis family, response regulator PixG
MSSVSLEEIYQELIGCHNNQFTGKFNITSSSGWQCNLLFFVGKAIGDSGGTHPLRRWLRQMSKYTSNISSEAGEVYSQENTSKGNYEPLKKLLKEGLISREEAVKMTSASIVEVLWEIFWLSQKGGKNEAEQLTYSLFPQPVDVANVPLVWVKLESLWQEAADFWQDWSEKGLIDYSPNLAPRIVNKAELQRLVSPSTYDNLTGLIDGDRTLRDLALKVKQEVAALTNSLLGYQKKGLMEFVEIADLDFNAKSSFAKLVEVKPKTERIVATTSQPTKKLLIAHIDDNPLDIQIMGQIVKEGGYDYINIQNPMLAMSTLIQQRPDLIFLDLVMPIANGYEVCAQLRRVSVLQETPIIILTNSDGIIDRVRAKMVNSTAFINKPIEPDKIFSTLFRYLPDLVISPQTA